MRGKIAGAIWVQKFCFCCWLWDLFSGRAGASWILFCLSALLLFDLMNLVGLRGKGKKQGWDGRIMGREWSFVGDVRGDHREAEAVLAVVF